MTYFTRIVALIAMGSLSASLVGAQSIPVHPLLSERPPGCHEHGGPAPSPSPADAQCCLTGHNVAVLQAAHAAQPLLSGEQLDLVAGPPAKAVGIAWEHLFTISAAQPPGSHPLRI